MQNVTPEMARLYIGTRACCRCTGSLRVHRADAYQGVVKCGRCGHEYLNVQFATRPDSLPRQAKLERPGLGIVSGARQLPIVAWARERARRTAQR